MIKNIVFDMGGVLIDYNPEKTLCSLFDKETADIALREIFRNKLWAEKDRGTITPDDIMEAAGDKIPAHAFEKVKDMTYNLYPYMPPFEEMYKLILNLRRNGYMIFLLSNASADFYDNKVNIPALELFDGYLISADYLLLKPEKEIYEKLFEKFGLKREECVFIDDVQANAQAAEECGMKAIRHDGNIDTLIKDLSAYGVKI